MALSWNEIKIRATAFAKERQDAANEVSQANPFLIGFFEMFGIINKRVATFEHAVKSMVVMVAIARMSILSMVM